MIAFVVRRLLQSIFVMLAVGFIAFSLFNYVGDPINNMVGQDTTLEQRQELRERLGLDDPFVVQYGRFLVKAVQGDFGISYRHRRPVSQLIAERMPATLELSLVAAFLALFIGVPMGVYTGLHRRGFLSQVFLTISLIGVSLPTFLIGILLILIFGVMSQDINSALGFSLLPQLPTFGRGEVTQVGWWSTGFLTQSGILALILPSITLALFQMTLIMRLVRSEMLEVLRTDYIKFARARGLTNRAVNFGHALKNTLVPVITITGLQLGSIIAFALITEQVFQWPGMGLLFIQAINEVDIPVMASYLMMIGFFFVVINLVVDLLYYVVDPRLRADRAVAAGHQ
ncbi:ABC transporter permease [Pelagibius sp.]|uniref:ABC transporter permease n=1 Tax=Pelagibius sp. TaxID=1931238 RepID=UPI003BAE975A